MKWLRTLLRSAVVLGGGPIPAPPGAVGLDENPSALRSAFDGEVGIHRLVLLLSPA